MLRKLGRRGFFHFQNTDLIRSAVIRSSEGIPLHGRQKTTATSTERENAKLFYDSTEYPKAKKVNGRFVLPWSGSRLPSMLVAAQWFLGSPNNSSVPGGGLKDFFQFDDKKLDRTLPVLKPDKARLESPASNSIQLTWIGHATVLVQMEGLNILIDPVFSDYCGAVQGFGVKRYRPAPCTVDELPEIDAVCISHNHYDHLDYNSVCNLNKRFGHKLLWYVPMGLRPWIKNCGCNNVFELEWWDELSHPNFTKDEKAVKFAFTPAQHWCRRGLNDTNEVLWGSWSIIGPQHRFFFAGDSGYCHIFKQIGKRYGPFDLAAIPIGAYEPRGLMSFQHVNPQEAVEIHQDVKSNSSVAIHWGTFNLSYEHYLDPPRKLIETLDMKGIPRAEFHTIKHGETKVVKRSQESD
ncbi:N-acyl-phosphatidylethanolamine-hydrolyzing phospholipase D-like [Pocillopora damicornis]|nr:N-acyl-phosphatidylethanolamine-hydrolyzing phospholipase D-like [Pocillopora damicornis]